MDGYSNNDADVPDMLYFDSDEEEVHAKTLGMRIQGKLASKMITKGLVKQIVDDTTSDIIDDCYRVARTFLQSKKAAEKVMKDVIKIIVKMVLLDRNAVFTEAEILLANQFYEKFNLIAKTVVKNYEVAHSYDGDYLENNLKECQGLLKRYLKNHLTEKSMTRIDHVFKVYSDRKLLDAVFAPGSVYRPYVSTITTQITTLMDQGQM